jgi:hypothetical protein
VGASTVEDGLKDSLCPNYCSGCFTLTIPLLFGLLVCCYSARFIIEVVRYRGYQIMYVRELDIATSEIFRD